MLCGHGTDMAALAEAGVPGSVPWYPALLGSSRLPPFGVFTECFVVRCVPRPDAVVPGSIVEQSHGIRHLRDRCVGRARTSPVLVLQISTL